MSVVLRSFLIMSFFEVTIRPFIGTEPRSMRKSRRRGRYHPLRHDGFEARRRPPRHPGIRGRDVCFRAKAVHANGVLKPGSSQLGKCLTLRHSTCTMNLSASVSSRGLSRDRSETLTRRRKQMFKNEICRSTSGPASSTCVTPETHQLSNIMH